MALLFLSGIRGDGDILVKMSDSDLQLLERYARQHAEDAFAELVCRHLDLVFSAALRQVRSPQLAEEVAQSAFTDLARQAHQLAPDTVLSAWLYQVTRRTAIDVVRREARRQAREQVACELNAMHTPASSCQNPMGADADWAHIEPLLEEAMQELDDADRVAVLLRYFENKSLREVGQTLGTNEDAARKRVSRAVDRLREFLARRGVAVGASGLGALISANAVQAAPAGLAATISVAVAGTTITTAASATATKAFAMTALHKTVITATVVAAVGTGVYEIRHASRLRDQVRTLQQQQAPLTEQIQQLQQDRGGLAGKLARLREEHERLSQDRSELLRLRGEVGVLRNRTNDLEKLLASMTNRTQTAAPGSATVAEGAFPRESWKFAGYATPEASFQSMTFACSRGDIKAVLGSLVPEVRSKQERAWENQPETQLKDRLINGILDVTGFRIIRKDIVADDEVFLTVVTEGKGVREQKLRLKKIDDEWKIDPRQLDPATGQYK